MSMYHLVLIALLGVSLGSMAMDRDLDSDGRWDFDAGDSDRDVDNDGRWRYGKGGSDLDNDNRRD